MVRSRRRATRAVSAALAALVPLAAAQWSAPAWAIDKVACVTAAESAQRLRARHHLVASREQLVVCASTDCPSVVSQDCTVWLGEVDRSLASVVVLPADDRGQPVDGARVLVDGAAFAAQPSPTPSEIDPGDHVFRCERDGFAPGEARVTLKEGERGRAVPCTLRATLSAAQAAASSAPTPAPPPATAMPLDMRVPEARNDVGTSTGGGIPWPSWLLGGVGLAGVGVGTYFGLSEMAQQRSDAAAGGCKPNCSPHEIDSIQTKIDVSYVSFAVGAVALGAAVIIAIVHASSSRPANLPR